MTYYILLYTDTFNKAVPMKYEGLLQHVKLLHYISKSHD